MNKYVFVQSSVCRIGGAQQYLYKKIKFLKERGFEIKVLVGATAPTVFIKQLEEYNGNFVNGLLYSPCFFNKRDQKKIIDEAIKFIDPQEDEKIFIESCTAGNSLWCEMIAKKIGAKHFTFDFEEVFHTLSRSHLDYMNFKHLRRELCGISPKALPLMFKNYKKVSEEEAYCYRAMCSDPIDDVDDNTEINSLIEKLKKYDLVIGSIGHAKKPFLIPTLKGIKKYICARPKTRFAVILIGGAEQKKYEDGAKKIFDDVENADFYCTGRIFPIPRKLVELCSAFVSSSGSASTTAMENIPTVSISPCTFGANGILNYTTRFSAVPGEELNLPIESQLEEIIDNRYCENHQSLGMYDALTPKEEAKLQFTKQIDFVLSNDVPPEYYDVSKVKKEGKVALVAFFARLIGRKLFCFIVKTFR